MDHSDSSATRVQGMGKARVVCCFLGFGSLLSWNSILSLGDYYYELFPHYHPSRILPLVYQPFELITMFILAYNLRKINTRKRILIGYILFCVSTFALLMIDLATSGKGGITTYLLICVFVAAFGVANAFVQGGLVGDLAFMCPEFMQSFSAGLAASGALTSVMRVITKGVFDKTDHGLRKGALLFLAISTFFALLCIFLYAFVYEKLHSLKHFRKKAASEGSETITNDLKLHSLKHIRKKATSEGSQTQTVTTDLADERIQNSDSEILQVDNAERLSMMQLLRTNIDYELDLYLIYVLTLSIVPGFLFENTGSHKLRSWYTVVLITAYNVWDLIGRYVPLVKYIKLESRTGLMISSVSRFMFIPSIYFTAKYGDQGWMIMLISLLGLTNGYLTVCVLTVAPKGYKAPEQNVLGNLLVTFLAAGIFSGVGLGWLWIIGKG